MSRDTAVAQPCVRASALRVGTVVGTVVLAAVVVFGLGVMVGKRVAESVPAVAAPPSALPTETVPPVPPPPPSAGAIPPERLTFYDRLSGVAPVAPVALPDGEAPPQATTASLPAPQPAREPARSEAPAEAAAKAAATAVRPRPPADGPAARIRKLGGKGRFAVQVASVKDRAKADTIAARVRSEGFEALTVMVSIKGQTWYRIRAGTFPDKQSAVQAAGIFRSAYGFEAIAAQD